jgi:hypothetical protein
MNSAFNKLPDRPMLSYSYLEGEEALPDPI